MNLPGSFPTGSFYFLYDFQLIMVYFYINGLASLLASTVVTLSWMQITGIKFQIQMQGRPPRILFEYSFWALGNWKVSLNFFVRILCIKCFCHGLAYIGIFHDIPDFFDIPSWLGFFIPYYFILVMHIGNHEWEVDSKLALKGWGFLHVMILLVELAPVLLYGPAYTHPIPNDTSIPLLNSTM
jgi:hypothetical protein